MLGLKRCLSKVGLVAQKTSIFSRIRVIPGPELSRCSAIYKNIFSTLSTQPEPSSETVFETSSESFLSQNQDQAVRTSGKGIVVAVKAYYIARSIDIIRVHSNNLYGDSNKKFCTKSVTISINEEKNQYISIFNYGACVFFNIPTAEHLEHLRCIKEAAVISSVQEGLMQTEDYRVIIHDQLSKPSVMKAEHVKIRCLDSNNIVIVGTVMAQTVALDYYSVAVERMIDTFMLMNVKIEETGDFNQLDKKSLYKLVAANNTVITNVLSKLGIFEGSDAAWENADYYTTWEALRKDFELDNRFKDLDLKLDIVKDNARFFLEIAHNQKSTSLEWIIIILVASEVAISIAGHALPYMLN